MLEGTGFKHKNISQYIYLYIIILENFLKAQLLQHHILLIKSQICLALA